MISKYSELYSRHEIHAVCQITRQGLSKQLKPIELQQNLTLKVKSVVKEARQSAKRMGARAIFYTYNVDFSGINKFEKIVSELGLNVPPLKRKYVRTTNPQYDLEDINLTHGIILFKPRQVIVGDITYLILPSQTYYIFTLKDAYSGYILGLHAAQNMKAEQAIKTLKQALKENRKEDFIGTIHHTDAGSQYKSKLYKNLLAEYEIKMSIADNCLENGIAEQLNGLIKNDYLDIDYDISLNKLQLKLKETKIYLNTKRKVKALGYKTPIEFEKEQLALATEKRKTKQLYDFNAKQ